MSVVVLNWPEAERADDERIAGAMLAYCPVCRRPASSEPLPAPHALQRVARHLIHAHDSFFAALLRIYLGAPVGDPKEDPVSGDAKPPDR